MKLRALLVCAHCGEQTFDRDLGCCLACCAGEDEQAEPFREGWDEP